MMVEKLLAMVRGDAEKHGINVGEAAALWKMVLSNYLIMQTHKDKIREIEGENGRETHRTDGKGAGKV